MQNVPVLLVQMPFGQLFWPSIGLSLLKAGLARRSITSRVLYPTFNFAQLIGLPLYTRIAEGRQPRNTDLAGEWLFAEALWGGQAVPAAAWIDYLRNAPDREPRQRPGEKLLGRLLEARAQVADFLDACVEEITALAPAIVGFSSVFQQHTASLALARRLRARLPATLLVMGGANVEGEMGEETLVRFPFLDMIVSSEADLVFPDLVERVLAGGRPRGVLCGTPVTDLDSLAAPDYADYFAAFADSRFSQSWQPGVFFETSRGCWWGERQHCTFCGLNGATMLYRSKSAACALAQLEALISAHPDAPVAVVDNILDLGYFKDFVPMLAERRLAVELFYETKSNLRKEQVKQLHEAGITCLQPGIESLSDDVLKEMKKGVSAAQNIQLLKWCEEYGVTPLWNFLWGFPGEDPEEYRRMARLVPSLVHLEPPVAAAAVRLDRFSPNYMRAAELGFADVAPFPSYALVHPLPPDSLRRLAYYFTHGYRDPRDVAVYTKALAAAIRTWRRNHARSALLSADLGTHLVVMDLRPGTRHPLHVLDGIERAALLACDEASGLTAICQRLSEWPSGDVARAIATLTGRRLLLELAERWVSLVVPLGNHQPGPQILKRLSGLARSTQRSAGGLVKLRVPERLRELTTGQFRVQSTKDGTLITIVAARSSNPRHARGADAKTPEALSRPGR